MIPILWRYLIKSYLKVFSLSVCSFIAILLVSRFKDMARFTALSGDGLKTALFALYQIPLILPLALPISALIASLLLFQRLSHSHELTALRASGVSLSTLFAPVLITSLFLSLANFSLCSSISPYCRRETKTLLYRETSANPLLLLQRQNLIKTKGTYLHMDVKKEGKSADNFILVAHNESNQRLTLLMAKHLKIAKETLVGLDVAMISHLFSEKGDAFEPLILENQSSVSTSAPVLSTVLKKNRPHLDVPSLSLKMLKMRALESKKKALASHVEILRRITLALATFSFTFLGAAFGYEQTRNPSKKGLFIALFLALTVLMSYLLGKELKSHPLMAIFAFLAPHPLIWIGSSLQLRQISRGLR
jgi:lipopolysaccharide export system permease protein